MTDEEHQQMAAAQANRMAQVRAAEQQAAQAAARAELAADLTALKRLGVRSFKGSGIDVVFFPEAAPDEKTPKPADSPDICAGCKHPLFAHVNGACAEGCDVEMCGPAPK